MKCMPLEIVKHKKEQKHRASVRSKTFCLKSLGKDFTELEKAGKSQQA